MEIKAVMGMPSCLEVTKAVSSGELEKLSFFKKMLVRMHLAMCKVCSSYVRQLCVTCSSYRKSTEAKAAPERSAALSDKILCLLGVQS